MRMAILAVPLSLAGCAHTPIGRYGVTVAEVHSSGPRAQSLAATGELIVRTQHCALSRADLRSVLTMLERAPVVIEREVWTYSGAREYDPRYSPSARYVIHFERGRHAPLLLFFKPRRAPVREVTVVQFNGTLRQLGFAGTQTLQEAVARAGCTTWAGREERAI